VLHLHEKLYLVFLIEFLSWDRCGDAGHVGGESMAFGDGCQGTMLRFFHALYAALRITAAQLVQRLKTTTILDRANSRHEARNDTGLHQFALLAVIE
jgi:hypothetical protein